MITEVKNTVPWTHLIEEFHGEIEHFMKKNCKRKIKLRVKKVTKRKGDKLYIKWRGYDNSLNCWINKKRLLYKMNYFPEPYSHNKNKIS